MLPQNLANTVALSFRPGTMKIDESSLPDLRSTSEEAFERVMARLCPKLI